MLSVTEKKVLLHLIVTISHLILVLMGYIYIDIYRYQYAASHKEHLTVSVKCMTAKQEYVPLYV